MYPVNKQINTEQNENVVFSATNNPKCQVTGRRQDVGAGVL